MLNSGVDYFSEPLNYLRMKHLRRLMLSATPFEIPTSQNIHPFLDISRWATENQWALWAWQHLEQPIRRLIPKPRKGVTSRGFADVLQRNLQREYWETKPSWDANHSGLLVLFNPCSQFSLSSLFNSFSQFTSLDQLRHHNLWKEMLILLRRRHRPL